MQWYKVVILYGCRVQHCGSNYILATYLCYCRFTQLQYWCGFWCVEIEETIYLYNDVIQSQRIIFNVHDRGTHQSCSLSGISKYTFHYNPVISVAKNIKLERDMFFFNTCKVNSQYSPFIGPKTLILAGDSKPQWSPVETIFGGSLDRVTLVVDWRFLLQNFGQVVETFCCSVNADGVGIVLAGGGDTSTLRVVTELVWPFCTELWWGAKN